MENLTNTSANKLWNRQFVIINLITTLAFFADYLLVTAVPLYALRFGGDESTAGAFMSIISLTALFVRPLLGHLLDVRSRRLVLILAIAGFSAAALFYGRMTSLGWILALAGLHGLGISGITTAAPTVYVDVTPRPRLAEGISLFGLAMNLTAAIGPVAALWLIQSFSHQTAFSAALIILVLAGGLIWPLNYEKRRQKPSTVSRLTLSSLLEKSAFKPAAYQLLLGFGASIIFSFVPLYAAARNIVNIGPFFIINAAFGLAASLVIGRLALKYGIRRLFVPALLLVCLSFVLLAYARTLPLMILAAALYGLGNSVGFALINIISMETAPASRRGAANATLYAAMDIGVALGSLVIGTVAARFSFTFAFLVAGGIVFLDLFLFLLVHREIPGYGTKERCQAPF
jgi:MFS family permease